MDPKLKKEVPLKFIDDKDVEEMTVCLSKLSKAKKDFGHGKNHSRKAVYLLLSVDQHFIHHTFHKYSLLKSF